MLENISLKPVTNKGFFFAKKPPSEANFAPRVEKVGTYYSVSGINVKAFASDLKNNFGTSVIFSKIVKVTSSRTFKIHQFFMVEMAWILEHLVGQQNKKVVNRYYVGIHKYKQLLDELKTKTWINTTYMEWEPYDLTKPLALFNKTPYDDQREFLEEYARIKYGFQLKGCLLDAAVGSGKSLASLMWAEMTGTGPIFVITPKNLVQNPWLDEINGHYKKPPKVWTSIDGTSILDHKDAKIFLITKEAIRTEGWDKILRVLTKNGAEPGRMIVDESHNYNVPTSAQSTGLIEFGTHPFISDVLEMSGTPIKAQGKETYTLFAMIDKFFDETVRQDFLRMYGRDNSYLNEMLAHRLGRIKFTIKAISDMGPPPEPIIVRVKFPGCEQFTLDNIRKEMVMYITERLQYYTKMMPEYYRDWKAYVQVYRDMNRENQIIQARLDRYVEIVERFRSVGYNNWEDAPLSKFCNEVEKEISVGLRGEELKYFRHIKSAVKYVALKIRGEALGNVLGKARMEAVRGVIAHAQLPKYIESAKKKTLVYTSYVDVVHALGDYFATQGLESILLYGDNTNEIDAIIKEFTENKNINPLVTTFNTLREGKQMTMANQILMMNSPFRSYELIQTIARIHRRGQDEECFVYLFDLNTGQQENITSRSIDIMQWSEEMVAQILGGGKLPGATAIGVSLKAVGGMESGMIWDVPKNQDDLDIDNDTFVPRVAPRKATMLLDIF